MRCYQEVYGDDIDGNRGILGWNHEIDADDYDVISEQVRDYIAETNEDRPEYINIYLTNPHTEEEIEFEIDINDYI